MAWLMVGTDDGCVPNLPARVCCDAAVAIGSLNQNQIGSGWTPDLGDCMERRHGSRRTHLKCRPCASGAGTSGGGRPVEVSVAT